jgi:hypothetical protein
MLVVVRVLVEVYSSVAHEVVVGNVVGIETIYRPFMRLVEM